MLYVSLSWLIKIKYFVLLVYVCLKWLKLQNAFAVTMGGEMNNV